MDKQKQTKLTKQEQLDLSVRVAKIMTLIVKEAERLLILCETPFTPTIPYIQSITNTPEATKLVEDAKKILEVFNDPKPN